MEITQEKKIEHLRSLLINEISFAADFFDEINSKDDDDRIAIPDKIQAENDYALERSILIDYDSSAGEEFSEDLWAEVEKWNKEISEL